MKNKPPTDPPQNKTKSVNGMRKRLIRFYGYSLLAIVVFALLPVASVLLVGLIAIPAGCTVNEATIHPCIIAGVDFGDLLYIMGVLGWLMIGTLPMGAALLAMWAVALIIHLVVQGVRG